MLDFLKRMCGILETAQIPYMLSGSLALNVYTVPRMTRDIDMIVALQESNLDLFLSFFPSKSYYVSPIAALEAVRAPGMFNIIDYESGYKLDVIVLKPDLYRQTEFQRRVRTGVLGFLAYIVQPEDLILSKLLWIQQLDSERQRTDIQHLLALPEIDSDYLNHWISELNLKTHGLFGHV